jgi:hypothetical protein
MEPTTLQRSILKKLDELRRIRGSIDPREFPLTKSQKALVLEGVKVMEVRQRGEATGVMDFIIAKGVDDPVLVLKATTSRPQALNEEVDCFHKARVGRSSKGKVQGCAQCTQHVSTRVQGQEA